MKINRFNSRRAAIVYFLTLTSTVFLSYGYFAGITGRTKKNGFTEGCMCHSKIPFTNVTVTISGPDTVGTGETVNFLIRITGGPLVRGGTNIAVSRGTLNLISGSGLRKIDDELTHELPKGPSQGAVSFQFSYTAPSSEGRDTIFANGNSVNFDMLPYNDNWNFAESKILTVRKPIGINIISGSTVKEFSLWQNYPNPFNPSTKIKFDIPSNVKSKTSNVRIVVYNFLGESVATLVDKQMQPGSYEVDFDGNNLSSGTYFYRIEAGDFSDSKKMLLIK